MRVPQSGPRRGRARDPDAALKAYVRPDASADRRDDPSPAPDEGPAPEPSPPPAPRASLWRRLRGWF